MVNCYLVSKNRLYFFVLVSCYFVFSCTQISPQFEEATTVFSDGKTGNEIFQKSFIKHGGNQIGVLNDVNVSIDGEWYYLITKIQPKVTDTQYRQQSQERILLDNDTYAAIYTGPSGNKQVLRTLDSIFVSYNNKIDNNLTTKEAAALTSDAFYLFTLGVLALEDRVSNWTRLTDGTDNGKNFYRINGVLQPGIGLSDKDYITIWVDKKTELTYRLHITLEGFETTKGAHVDTTFLNYKEVDNFILPTHFFERVLGPIAIDAHEWWYTGIDINRGLQQEDVDISGWTEKALSPATIFEQTLD